MTATNDLMTWSYFFTQKIPLLIPNYIFGTCCDPKTLTFAKILKKYDKKPALRGGIATSTKPN